MNEIIEVLKAKLAEVENKPDYDKDYDYNVGVEDGLITAINVIQDNM